MEERKGVLIIVPPRGHRETVVIDDEGLAAYDAKVQEIREAFDAAVAEVADGLAELGKMLTGILEDLAEAVGEAVEEIKEIFANSAPRTSHPREYPERTCEGYVPELVVPPQRGRSAPERDIKLRRIKQSLLRTCRQRHLIANPPAAGFLNAKLSPVEQLQEDGEGRQSKSGRVHSRRKDTRGIKKLLVAAGKDRHLPA